jgi:prophage tail gpP-like protein
MKRRRRHIILEKDKDTLTKSDVQKIFKDELKSREMDKLVRKISVEVIKDLYRVLWQRSNVWTSL